MSGVFLGRVQVELLLEALHEAVRAHLGIPGAPRALGLLLFGGGRGAEPEPVQGDAEAHAAAEHQHQQQHHETLRECKLDDPVQHYSAPSSQMDFSADVPETTMRS